MHIVHIEWFSSRAKAGGPVYYRAGAKMREGGGKGGNRIHLSRSHNPPKHSTPHIPPPHPSQASEKQGRSARAASHRGAMPFKEGPRRAGKDVDGNPIYTCTWEGGLSPFSPRLSGPRVHLVLCRLVRYLTEMDMDSWIFMSTCSWIMGHESWIRVVVG